MSRSLVNNRRVAEDVRAQADFMREQRRFLEARIRAVAASEPDLPMELLCERFGQEPYFIKRIIGAAETSRRWRPLLSREDAARATAPDWRYGVGWHTVPRRTG